MKYEKPVMDIVEIQYVDVITLSGNESGDDSYIEGDWGQ